MENGEWRKQTTDFPAEAGGATDYADYTAVARKNKKPRINTDSEKKLITVAYSINVVPQNIKREAATN